MTPHTGIRTRMNPSAQLASICAEISSSTRQIYTGDKQANSTRLVKWKIWQTGWWVSHRYTCHRAESRVDGSEKAAATDADCVSAIPCPSYQPMQPMTQINMLFTWMSTVGLFVHQKPQTTYINTLTLLFEIFCEQDYRFCDWNKLVLSLLSYLYAWLNSFNKYFR